MSSSAASRLLRNSARGGQTYGASRHKFATNLLRREEPPQVLSPYLKEKLFKVTSETWNVLSFGPKDWPLLDKLSSSRSIIVENNYARLLVDYITTNVNRVNRMYEVSAIVSAAVLRDDADSAIQEQERFDGVDSQSLFSFRLFAAQRSHSNDVLVNYFKHHMSSDWLKKRFLYPFVYYAINNTSDLYIDTFLSYVISGTIKFISERDTIKFLLCDEIVVTQSAAFKFYIALLCHPFDACEMLLNHLELEYFRTGAISNHHLALLRELQRVPGGVNRDSQNGPEERV